MQPIEKKCIEKILEQMNNYIYIINEKDENYETGFFCHIKYKDKTISVVIINKYLLDEELNNSIIIGTNDKHYQNIELGDIKYKNKNFNITMIEIKINKNNNINFIELDDKLYEKESEMYYNKESIYIIQFNSRNDISLSFGMINNIEKSSLIYSSKLNPRLNFSLIFNLSNNKLIGINGNKLKYYNYGIYFNFIINGFINNYKYINMFRTKKKYKYNQLRNDINILMNADPEDINKNIYFLNKDFTQLNELNTELYINNKKNSFKNYY